MKVYLDACSLQRPLDGRHQIRVALEAEAILGVLKLCETGQLELISSEALTFETARIQNAIRQEYSWQTLSIAKWFVSLDDQIEQRAKEFLTYNIKPLDALHLAMAEIGQADFFCTCDDRLLKKAREIIDLSTRVVSPIELIDEVEKWSIQGLW